MTFAIISLNNAKRKTQWPVLLRPELKICIRSINRTTSLNQPVQHEHVNLIKVLLLDRQMEDFGSLFACRSVISRWSRPKWRWVHLFRVGIWHLRLLGQTKCWLFQTDKWVDFRRGESVMTWDASHLISSLYLYINIYLFILDVRYSTSRIKIFF
jgi:hypothetical protein